MRFYYDSRRAGLGDLVNFLSYVYRSVEILQESSSQDTHEIIICYKRTGHVKELSDKIKVVKNILKSPSFYIPVLFCDTQIEYFYNDEKGHFRERIIPHNYWPAKNLNKKNKTNNVGLFFYISFDHDFSRKKHRQGRWRKHISQEKAELIELYLRTEKNYNIIDIPYLEYKEQPVYGTTIGMEYDENSQLNYCNLVIDKLCECEFVITSESGIAHLCEITQTPYITIDKRFEMAGTECYRWNLPLEKINKIYNYNKPRVNEESNFEKVYEYIDIFDKH